MNDFWVSCWDVLQVGCTYQYTARHTRRFPQRSDRAIECDDDTRTKQDDKIIFYVTLMLALARLILREVFFTKTYYCGWHRRWSTHRRTDERENCSRTAALKGAVLLHSLFIRIASASHARKLVVGRHFPAIPLFSE